MVIALVISLQILFNSSASAQEAPKPIDLAQGVATIENGQVRGLVEGGVARFLGIPFAAPPMGNLRWKPPQAVESHWPGIRDMTKFGPACAQTLTLGVFAAKSQSEDCLYLNVFAPSRSPDNPGLPVMVWIHGGGFFDGESNDYDGSKLAREGHVIVVTLNYRLNVFGFLALPGLEAEGQPFANYGLMDQQAALRWVKANVGSFGGDPQRTTIFGESSGAQSVLLHLISPTARTLFQRAIIESGSLFPQIVSIATAEVRGEEFAKDLHCDGKTPPETVACLRSLTVGEIQAGAPRFMGLPRVTLDGSLITKPLAAAISEGDFNRVPVVDGTNQDEFGFILAVEEGDATQSITKANYPGLVREGRGFIRGAGDFTDEVLQRYRLNDYGNPDLAYSALATDASMNSVCDALRLDLALSRYVPVYAYLFADRTAPSYMKSTLRLGAYHTSELQYLFPLYHGGAGVVQTLSSDQLKLSDSMVRYWTSFAAFGDPNSLGLPSWPSFAASSATEIVRLDSTQIEVDPTPHVRDGHNCDLWDKIPSGNPAAELR